VPQQQPAPNPLGSGLEDVNSVEEEEVIKLEKLYDLDTSRFEEEYSNLPSSKKKLMLNQLGEEIREQEHL